MGEGAWLIGFLVVQRLAELGLAQWNTLVCAQARRRRIRRQRIIR